MAEHLRLARLYLVMLAIVTFGRWVLSFRLPYDKGTDVFSIVTLTLFASLFYAAFARRWLGYRVLQAVELAAVLGLLSQVVILLSTVASYALGIDSYFNHPRALNQPEAVPFGRAIGIRMGGLVANTVFTGIAGALGWFLGAVLPASPGPDRGPDR